MKDTASRPVRSADEVLLDEAEREVAGEGLPTTIGGYRRRRLLTYDALSTTWVGWHVTSGTPAWISVLRPRWRHRPLMVRRFLESVAVAPLRGLEVVGDAELPIRCLRTPGTPVAELIPQAGEAPVSLPLRASIFAHGLDGLAGLHGAGRTLGAPIENWLTVGAEGPGLVDRMSFGPPTVPTEEVQNLARIIVDLAPEAPDPIATLARTWCALPPPSARDGARLVSRAMASHLAWLRHQLVRSRRHRTRGGRIGRLSRLLRRLNDVQAPPVGCACLGIDSAGREVHVESDGERLRGGARELGTHANLPVVWSSAHGLDPVASRILVRVWSGCRGDDKERAARAHDELGVNAVDPLFFVRWLRAARRLRSARLLLNAESSVRLLPAVHPGS